MLLRLIAFITVIGSALADPKPAIITPTSTVPFCWQAVPDVAGARGYHIRGYEYFERIGNSYVRRGSGKTPCMNVKNIGKKQRTFCCRALSDKGPGVISEQVFPGAMIPK